MVRKPLLQFQLSKASDQSINKHMLPVQCSEFNEMQNKRIKSQLPETTNKASNLNNTHTVLNNRDDLNAQTLATHKDMPVIYRNGVFHVNSMINNYSTAEK